MLKNLSKYSGLITLIGFAVLVVFIFISSKKINNQNIKLETINKELKEKQDAMNQLEEKEENLVQGITDLYRMSLNSFGWPIKEVDSISLDDSKVQEAVKANDQIRKFILEDNFQINSLTKLQYYPKERDMKKVSFAFKDLGFKLIEKPSNDALLDKKSNAIWYGDNVSIEEVKLVAYILIRSGVDLAFILNSGFLDDHKIMVGTVYANHPIISNAPNIKVDSILGADKFKNVPKLSPYPKAQN